jgi:predicted enzyme related to lactoylglutathione lyase
MKVTHYHPGMPCWADLGSADLDASKQFYSGVFGWQADAPDPQARGYTIFRKDGAAVAGVGPLQGPDQPPAWSVYASTDDADAAARRVEAAGGKVLMAPMDVLDGGRLAVFIDPAGAVSGVWQPLAFAGAKVCGEAGTLSWIELVTRDQDSAIAFYRSVHGWEPEVQQGRGYTLFKLGTDAVAGMTNPAQGSGDAPAHWQPYFGSDDTDATVAKVKELGGTVFVPPEDIPGVGRFAMAADPAGVNFSIMRGAM